MKEKELTRNFSVSKLVISAGLCVVVCFGLLATVSAQDTKVLAKIGNEVITEGDLKALADSVPEGLRESAITPEARQQVLEHLVDVYTMAAEAESQGLTKTADFQRMMKFAQKDLLAKLYFEKKFQELPQASEAEAKSFYDGNLDKFKTPESVRIRHILVKTEKEANDALGKLKKGAAFADLASQISICPSKSMGGDLDWMPKGRLVKEIEDVAFTLKKGEVTGPVKSSFGYHVVLLEDKRPEKTSSFDEVKGWLVQQLGFQKRQEYYSKLAQDLRTKLKVQVLATEAPVPAGPAAGPAPAAPAKPLPAPSAPKR